MRSATWQAQPLPGDWLANAEAAYEAIIMAINDQPVSLRLAGRACLRDDAQQVIAGVPDDAGRVDGDRGHPDVVLLAAGSAAGAGGSNGRRSSRDAPRRRDGPVCSCCWRRASRAAAADGEAPPPPVWITDASGARYRVRFDPGERLIFGVGAETRAPTGAVGLAAPGFALEVGLFHRSDRPAPGWDVHWKKNHEIARLRLRPAGDARDVAFDGVLYRGLFLRQSREGTLTLADESAGRGARCRSTSACASRSAGFAAASGPSRVARRWTPASSTPRC